MNSCSCCFSGEVAGSVLLVRGGGRFIVCEISGIWPAMETRFGGVDEVLRLEEGEGNVMLIAWE